MIKSLIPAVRLASVLLAASITSSFAQSCPTAADLDKGLRVLSPDGEVETFTRTSEHIVTSDFIYDEGQGSTSLLAQGAYVVQMIDIVDGEPDPQTRMTTAYPLNAADMPVPTDGGYWSAQAAVLDSSGLVQERHEYTFGAKTTFTLGACSYEMIPVTAYFPDSDGYTEVLFFLPELGISLLRSTQDKGEDADVYSFTAIEAVQ